VTSVFDFPLSLKNNL